ncbi:MAG: hypothetical protein IKG56_02605 [Clostridia bacterium]|nr:hypothetical protein [Clostridia bacterium]
MQKKYFKAHVFELFIGVILLFLHYVFSPAGPLNYLLHIRPLVDIELLFVGGFLFFICPLYGVTFVGVGIVRLYEDLLQ